MTVIHLPSDSWRSNKRNKQHVESLRSELQRNSTELQAREKASELHTLAIQRLRKRNAEIKVLLRQAEPGAGS